MRNPDTFVYAVIGDVDSLDPHWQYDGVSHMVMWQTYETLLFYKGSSPQELAPMLATVVPTKANSLISADGLSYTFPLRKGVVFHDGTPLTPEDVRYSILRYLLMDRAGGSSSLLLEPMLGLQSTRGPDGRPLPGLFEAADKAVQAQGNSVVMRLKAPFAPALHVLAEFAPIVSKAFTVAQGGWDGTEASWTRFNDPSKQSSGLYERMNGTGPFKLERWDRQQKQLVLQRNDGYWREPAALRRLVFKTIDEFSTRKLLLAGGDADAIMLERQYAPQVQGLEGAVVDDDLPFLEVHNAFVFNFSINPQANPYIGSGKLDGNGIPTDFFADINVRKGLAHAFDYEAYIKDGYRGKGTRARGPIPAGLAGHNPRQALPAFDPQKAADHLRKAHGGKVWDAGFRMTIAYMQGRADRELACRILKRNLEALNPRFKVDVRGVQWSTLLDATVARKIPMANARWALDYADPHNAVHPFLHSQGYYAKSSGYNNPRADRLVEEAVRELDPDRRKAMYRDLQATAWEDLPAVFTVDTFHLRARRSWVKDWEYNPILMYGYFHQVKKSD